MINCFKFCFYDLIRSKWSLIYFIFFFLLSFVLLYFDTNFSKTIISLNNILTILVPLVSIIFSITYYYDSESFIKFILTLPISRTNIFIGSYLGVTISLSISLILGILLPFLLFGVLQSDSLFSLILMLVIGIFLTFIFSGFAYLIGLLFDNKIKGFGFCMFLWLFFSVIYDGIFLIILFLAQQYPLEKLSLIITFFNPIDLARIIITMYQNISALMGFSGALFRKFFGDSLGLAISCLVFLFWLFIPFLSSQWIIKRKDF